MKIKQKRLLMALESIVLILFLVTLVQTEPKAAGRIVDSNSSRLVAVTFDDLPVVRGRNLPRMQAITTKILNHLSAIGIPTIGFVIEKKLGDPVVEVESVTLLEQWLIAGHDLGNHTYSHPMFYNTSLADFKESVLRGEIVTKQLLAKHNKQMQYFRHPYLNTGPDLATKAAFEEFLKDVGYSIAPVTIDNDEYIYALAYDNAESAGDTKLSARIGKDYVQYMEEMFAFYEQLSHDLLGRELAQILLLHANALNADYLDELVGMMNKRGYKFISLETALQDSAYKLPDHYIGKRGLSWLQRWWITQGNEQHEEPNVPKWAKEVAYPDR